VRGENELRGILGRIDGRGYAAYRELAGSFRLGALELAVDHVQPDPFAPPSRLRLRVPMEDARFDPALFRERVRRIALEDLLARALAREIARRPRGPGEGKSGVISVDAGGQEVLERSAVAVRPEYIEARLSVGLPAEGRRVLGWEASKLLCDEVRHLGRVALRASSLAPGEAEAFVECVEDQEQLRGQLRAAGLVAFLADGAVLPRESGASERPLAAGLPLRAPDGLRVELALEDRRGAPRTAKGLGIPEGVTLVVGGGYHGKSTLLRALERGVYPHVPGDGREGVVTRGDAVTIRAEDGRRVERVDLSGFIGRLPGGRVAGAFTSEDASGSTSQAANILEALEAGSRLLLLDEDTSATNFMVRDARMQALVPKEREPITPFVDRVRELAALGVSTVLVMGGSGDYLDVADTVIEMRGFQPNGVTEAAREVARAHPTGRTPERAEAFAMPEPRAPLPGSLDASKGRRELRIAVHGREILEFGVEKVDLRGVPQLVDASQTRAIGQLLELARRRLVDGKAGLPELLDGLEALLDERGLDVLGRETDRGPSHPGDFARPRRYEIAAALNRLRSMRMAAGSPRERTS
jgi:predicted ABC-class ATPase